MYSVWGGHSSQSHLNKWKERSLTALLSCVIAELFLEGTPLFTLSQLFKYRKGEFDPTTTYLHKIEDPEIRVIYLTSRLTVYTNQLLEPYSTHGKCQSR